MARSRQKRVDPRHRRVSREGTLDEFRRGKYEDTKEYEMKLISIPARTRNSTSSSAHQKAKHCRHNNCRLSGDIQGNQAIPSTKTDCRSLRHYPFAGFVVGHDVQAFEPECSRYAECALTVFTWYIIYSPKLRQCM